MIPWGKVPTSWVSQRCRCAPHRNRTENVWEHLTAIQIVSSSPLVVRNPYKRLQSALFALMKHARGRAWMNNHWTRWYTRDKGESKRTRRKIPVTNALLLFSFKLLCTSFILLDDKTDKHRGEKINENKWVGWSVLNNVNNKILYDVRKRIIQNTKDTNSLNKDPSALPVKLFLERMQTHAQAHEAPGIPVLAKSHSAWNCYSPRSSTRRRSVVVCPYPVCMHSRTAETWGGMQEALQVFRTRNVFYFPYPVVPQRYGTGTTLYQRFMS